MLYSVDDLSSGAEKKPVKAVNYYNFDQITAFDYIATTRIEPGCEKYFDDNQGCKCETCDELSCPCLKSGVADGNCYNYMKFCEKETCSCAEESCGNRGGLFGTSKFQLNTPLEVYLVNPQKGWGVRSKVNIAKEAFLCEYAGILSEDRDDVTADDYIFRVNYEGNSFMIDGNSSGNVGRFVNHSCDPNVTAVVSVYGKKNVPRLLFFTLRSIQQGEEITVSYGDAWWNSKVGLKCSCKSINCRYLNNVECENGA